MKVGGRSRAMSTPWCWSAPEEQQSPGTAAGVYVGKQGTAFGAHVLRRRASRREELPFCSSLTLNFQDSEELFPSGLDVDAGGHESGSEARRAVK